MSNRNVLVNRMRRMVQEIVREEKSGELKMKFKSAVGPRQPLALKIFWFITASLTAVLLIYQIYDRLTYFVSHPVTVDISVEKMQKAIFPQFTICSPDTSEMAKLMKVTGISPGNPASCLMLISTVIKKEGYNVTRIWEIANTTSGVTVARMTNSNDTPSIGTIPTPYASCATFYHGKAVTLMGEESALTIHVEKPVGTCLLSLMKYRFLERPGLPCSNDKQAFKLCITKCRLRKLENLTCRFPFMPPEVTLPVCNTSKGIYEEYLFGLNTVMGFFTSPEMCGCVPLCEQVFYTSVDVPEEFLNTQSQFLIYFHTDYARILSQRYLYDMIAFLSDVGGNMGLCFGISLLEIVYFIQYSVTSTKTKFVKNGTFSKEDPIFKIVQKVYFRTQNAIKLKAAASTSFQNRIILCYWILTFLCIVFTSSLLTLRILYYFTFPVTVTLELKTNTSIQYPMVTVCWENNAFKKQKKLLQKRKRLSSSCNVTLLDLLDPPISKNPEAIWNIATTRENWFGFFSKYAQEYQTTLDTPLPFGNCLTYVSELYSFAGSFMDFIVLSTLKPDPKCPTDVKIFITPPGEVINPTRYDIVPERTLSITALSIKTIRRNEGNYDAAIDPTCERNCIMASIRKKLDCRMPYIDDTDHTPLRSCNTTTEARKTEAVYMQAFITINPEQDCDCPKSNHVMIYESKMMIEEKDVGMSLLAFVYFNSRIEEFSKVSSYTLVKLLSEFGGNYSAILGMSVISTVEILLKAHQRMKTRRKNKLTKTAR